MSKEFSQPEGKITPSSEQKEELESREWRGDSRFRARAQKLFKALALSAALLGVGQAAEAKEGLTPPQGAEYFNKKFSESEIKQADRRADRSAQEAEIIARDLELKEKLQGKSKDGDVVYVQMEHKLDDRAAEKLGERAGAKEVVVLVQVHNEGDPNVHGDELDYVASYYGIDLGGPLAGEVNYRSSSMGPVRDRDIESVQAKSVPGAFRITEEVETGLVEIARQVILTRALRAVDREDSPAIQGWLNILSLNEEVKKFQSKYPEISLSQDVLDEISGASEK